jgi:hypothetical protein
MTGRGFSRPVIASIIQSEDLKDAGPWQSFNARLNFVAPFPARVDLCDQPLQNLFSFVFILKDVNGNLARMQCN